MELNEFISSIPSYIEEAIDTGRIITEGKCLLTTSLVSIGELDRVIENLHNLRQKNLINDIVAWNASVIFGVLLGEMIIGKHHLHWALDGDLPVVETEEGNHLFTITKLYKIITEKEGEGSPSSFYRGFLALEALQETGHLNTPEHP